MLLSLIRYEVFSLLGLYEYDIYMIFLKGDKIVHINTNNCPEINIKTHCMPNIATDLTKIFPYVQKCKSINASKVNHGMIMV